MANTVIPTAYFESKYKRLSRKFPSLDNELIHLEKDLICNPKLGQSLGSNLYKIRLSASDKGKGKSGGFRLITYLIQEHQNSMEVYLLTIFDKSEEGNIPKSVLEKLVKTIFK